MPPRSSPASDGGGGAQRLDTLDRSPLSAEIDRAGRAVVVVTAPPDAGRFDIRAQGRIRRFEGVPVDERVQLELPLGRAPPQGAIIDVLAVVRPPRGPEHGFDERTWLRRHGVHVVLQVDEWRRSAGAAASAASPTGSVGDSRVAIAPGLSGERRAVLEGIVLGDDDGAVRRPASRLPRLGPLPPARRLGAERDPGRRRHPRCSPGSLGVSRWIGELGALAGIAAYVLAVGAQPSVIRAGIAGSLASLAWLRGPAARRLVRAPARRRSRCSRGTRTSSSTPGFQLSFAAVAAIFTLVPRIVAPARGLSAAARSSGSASPSRPRAGS